MTVASQEGLVVRSEDGTRLDVWRSGRGPPLVLVHGTAADHRRWEPVRAGLAERFTLYAMDRRGRRESDDRRPYAVEREIEDLLAVMRVAGPRPRVLGHSFGAMCALEAAARTEAVERLVLYEGGFSTSDHPEWAPALERVAALIDAGRREEALEEFFRRVALVPDAAIEKMRGAPSWSARLASLHTIPRELRIAMAYRFRPDLAPRITAPTLLLVGGASSPSEQEDAARVAKTLPDARVVVLPGQGHVAMDTAPDLFVDQIVRFLA